MSQPQISVNRNATRLLEKILNHPEKYGVQVKKARYGATLIDAGIEAKGGFAAGEQIIEICMGGLGNANVRLQSYGSLHLPTVFVYSDNPVLATLGSQYAGWQIKEGNFFAIGSGPARAKALKPKEIYRKIGYTDADAEAVVMLLETDMYPPETLVKQLARECNTSPEQFFVVLTPTRSIAGNVQVSGRIVETGIHKLSKLGLDLTGIKHAFGYAPVAPVHPKFSVAMGRTNDAILYGGVAYYAVDWEGDEQILKKAAAKAPSNTSKSYGKPFNQIFKEANSDFYKIDPLLFAPAVVAINNLNTGRTFTAGEVNLELLKKSLLQDA